MVGKVTKLDFNTYNQTRGRYVRIVVFTNLEKPLISQVLINGNLQQIEYKSLLIVFFSYGRYSHSKDNYPHIQATGNKSEEYTLIIKNLRPDADMTIENDDFGKERDIRPRKKWERNCKCRSRERMGKKSKVRSRERSNVRDKGPSKTSGLSIGQSFKSSSALGPNVPLKDHLIGGAIQPNTGKTDTVVLMIKNFNNAFEEVEVVAVTINESILNSNNHSTITFQATSSSTLIGTKGINKAPKSRNTFNPVNSHDNGGKVRDPKGGWKINKTLKGPSNPFNAMGSSQVSLVGSMLMAADFISLELEDQVAKEKVRGETEGSDSTVHA
ncbi:hypothetical protein Golax_003837 [Gossypium laxum]|uniref:Uncharacterized protein n=1 Tax=Gossypium laxum TaxID=34288 RepID=A0A7J9AGW9_9ROSI|nr:hypothetical protein [Gossypium laxum]